MKKIIKWLILVTACFLVASLVIANSTVVEVSFNPFFLLRDSSWQMPVYAIVFISFLLGWLGGIVSLALVRWRKARKNKKDALQSSKPQEPSNI